jgi:DNA modification methylase
MNKYTNGLSDSLDMEDYFKWQCECIDEMMRVTKGVVFYNVQVITGNKVAVMKILGKYAEQIRDLLIWDKKTAEPAMHFGCLNSEFELIIAFDHGDCKGRQFRTANWERGTLSNIIRIGKNRENDHRAAFPLDLPRYLVMYFTELGGGSSRPVHRQRHDRHRLRQGETPLPRLRAEQGVFRQGTAAHRQRAQTAHTVLITINIQSV